MMAYLDKLMSKDEILEYSLICFDRDHTLIEQRGKQGDFCKGFGFELMEGRWDTLNALKDTHAIAICSNQGGVAMGYKSEPELCAEAGFLAGLLGFPLLQIYCPSHPLGAGERAIAIGANGKISEHWWAQDFSEFEDYLIIQGFRKPNPGMLLLAERLLKVPDGARCLFVGDSPDDWGAAAALHHRGWQGCALSYFPWDSFRL